MAYWTFRPVNTTTLSTWAADAAPSANKLMGHFRAGKQINNVFIDSAGTVSETQPAYWVQNPADPTGPYIVRVFYGGETYTDITDAEKALLVAAGYTVT